MEQEEVLRKEKEKVERKDEYWWRALKKHFILLFVSNDFMLWSQEREQEEKDWTDFMDWVKVKQTDVQAKMSTKNKRDWDVKWGKNLNVNKKKVWMLGHHNISI